MTTTRLHRSWRQFVSVLGVSPKAAYAEYASRSNYGCSLASSQLGKLFSCGVPRVER